MTDAELFPRFELILQTICAPDMDDLPTQLALVRSVFEHHRDLHLLPEHRDTLVELLQGADPGTMPRVIGDDCRYAATLCVYGYWMLLPQVADLKGTVRLLMEENGMLHEKCHSIVEELLALREDLGELNVPVLFTP